MILPHSPILTVSHLRKKYGDFVAVDDISFQIPVGKIVGFLGPNGAGKTTTIQMLTGITTRTAGDISYFGRDFDHDREYCLEHINSTSAFNTLLGRITVRENLNVFAHLYAVRDIRKKIDGLLKYFEIDDLAGKLYQYLSAGQKTRVNLVKSLLNDPKLILMDEPTASLDPDIADKTLALIENLRDERKLSILFTSHNMDEVARLCDWVIFIDHGRIVTQGTPENLIKMIPEVLISATYEGGHEKLASYFQMMRMKYVFHEHQRVDVYVSHDHVGIFLHDLTEHVDRILDIDIVKPKLEDVFIQIARKTN
ncbi:MAG: ABC transporter ATP-binding protein [Candidatus Roizmanbacteria bacterium]